MYDKNTKFLVVDDFSTMRKIVKKMLNELGYTNIIESDDGKNALAIVNEEWAKKDPIQFVVSDWNMPNMTGLEFLKAIRGHTDYKLMPFMLLTAESEQSQIIDAAKSGVSEYLIKPFTAASLKSKVERVYAKNLAAGLVKAA